MKKLIASILMISGLSLSSQVNNIQTTKPTIITQPAPFDPSIGTQMITCSAGNGYYVTGSDCACCNIHCTNGNNYIWCVCKDGTIFGGGAARYSNSSNDGAEAINIPMDITSSLTEDNNVNLDPTARIINVQKVKNAIISIDNEMRIDYQDYILIILPGNYEVKNDKLQTLCAFK
jgi:hypothetical protein